jgi:hypothetical protein
MLPFLFLSRFYSVYLSMYIISNRMKEKITLIEDINKGIKFLFGRNITVEEFDAIYDMSIEELELMFEDLQNHINLIISV